jgi:hypothetical protein
MEVKDAVFGNVGSIVCFRMSADDGNVMQRYFEPQFLQHDLVHMHNRHFVISMTIEGEKVPGFSAVSLNLPPQGDNYSAHIVERSRATYGSTREFVDRYIHERYLVSAPTKPAPQQTAPKQVVTQPTAPAKPAAQPKKEQPIQTIKTESTASLAANTDKPKRKRTRRRKKSNVTGDMSDGSTIHLK